MSHPQISVLMCVYKEPVEWLVLSINSILNQTFTDFEFIIICDNPEYNEGKEILNNYSKKDNRIKLIFNTVNIGLTKSLNKGLQLAKGEFVARMDADDISMIDRFEKQISLLNRTEADLCHCNITYIDENNLYMKSKSRILSNFDYEDLFLYSVIVHPTVMFRRSLLKLRVPFYNEECTRSQDYELWCYLYLNKVRFSYINEPCLKYRKSLNQISSSNSVEQIKIYKKIRNNFIEAFLAKSNIFIEGKTNKEIIELIKLVVKSKNNIEAKPYFKILYIFYYRMVLKSTFVYLDYLLNLKVLYYNGLIKFVYLTKRFLGLKSIDYLL